MIRVDGSVWRRLRSGSVSFRGGLGSGFCISGLGAKPHTCGFGIGPHNFYIYRVPTLNWTQLSHWTNYPESVTWPCSLRSQFQKGSVLSRVWLFVTPGTAACQASLSITNPQSLLKLMSIKSVMPSKHLILCRPFLLPSIFPSIKVFSNESVLRIGWPKDWSFSISPSYKYSEFPLG